MRVSRRVYLLAPQVDRDGHNWQMVAKPPAGSKGKNLYKTSGTRDRAEAEVRARRWEDLLNGLAAPLPPRATVAALLSKYLAVREVDGTPTGTVITYRTAMKRIAAEVGSLTTDAVDGPAVARLRDALAARLDGKTVNVTMSRFRTTWRWAVEQGHVKAPWPDVAAAKVIRTKKRPMRPKEVGAFLLWAEKRSGGWAGGLFGMAADTGARSGDVCSRDGRHVDRERRRVWIYDAKKKRERWSGITARTLALLPEVGPDEPLFQGQRGRLTPSAVLYVFRQGVKEIGVDDADRLDVHSLRRTNAKEADRAGVPQGLGMKQRGHDTVSMTMHYAHDPDDDEDMAAVADQIASRWTPHLTPLTDPLPASAESANARKIREGQWLKRNHGRGTQPVRGACAGQDTPLPEVARTPEKRRGGARSPVGGRDALILEDEHAETFEQLIDMGPKVRAALRSLASPWRLVALLNGLDDEFESESEASPAREPAQKGKKRHVR